MPEEDVPFGEKKVCCCQMRTFLMILNSICGLGMIVFGIFQCLSWIALDRQIVLNFSFFIYQLIFGFLIFVSFCDFKFILENFAFLKTNSGRGWFDIFCCFMFLVTTSDNGLSGIIFTCVLGCCGVFFIALSCCVKEEIKDIDSKALVKEGSKSAGQSLLNAQTS